MHHNTFLNLQAIEFFFFAGLIGLMAVIFAVMSFFYKPISKIKDHEGETVALMPKNDFDDNNNDDDDLEEMALYPDSSDL